MKLPSTASFASAAVGRTTLSRSFRQDDCWQTGASRRMGRPKTPATGDLRPRARLPASQTQTQSAASEAATSECLRPVIALRLPRHLARSSFQVARRSIWDILEASRPASPPTASKCKALFSRADREVASWSPRPTPRSFRLQGAEPLWNLGFSFLACASGSLGESVQTSETPIPPRLSRPGDSDSVLCGSVPTVRVFCDPFRVILASAHLPAVALAKPHSTPELLSITPSA